METCLRLRVSKKAAKYASGVLKDDLIPTGRLWATLNKAITRTLTATVTAMGAVSRAITRTLSATLTLAGALAESLGVTLSFAGSITATATVSAAKNVVAAVKAFLSLLGVGS